MKKNKKSINVKNILMKILLCMLYLFVIGVLIYSAYSIFKDEDKIVSWKDVEKTSQYAYIEITQMSEAFAQIDNKQIHFVMEKESTGAWHTYLIAINKDDYNKYKDIIDFTYERTKESPKTIKAYGYPRKIPTSVKKLAIKNITKFVPIENQVVINEKNFDEYLTNTYLDTTMEKTHPFNYYVLILLIMSFIIFIVIIYTIVEKDKSLSRKTKNMSQKKTTKSLKTKKATNKKEENINKNSSDTNKKANIEKTNSKRKANNDVTSTDSKVKANDTKKEKKIEKSSDDNSDKKSKNEDIEVI